MFTSALVSRIAQRASATIKDLRMSPAERMAAGKIPYKSATPAGLNKNELDDDTASTRAYIACAPSLKDVELEEEPELELWPQPRDLKDSDSEIVFYQASIYSNFETEELEDSGSDADMTSCPSNATTETDSDIESELEELPGLYLASTSSWSIEAANDHGMRNVKDDTLRVDIRGLGLESLMDVVMKEWDSRAAVLNVRSPRIM
ncbi:hypothetical protein EXIGLDRAFT_707625 [Exidia glandulosa HHB12029]|uniref:Uncharacterized protein n=1 Tax=Exidia glandulosa HHB12029 TaxID=1314781 RepID=A0A165PHQ8_EXIGL|nr:hypothetical protein EXIGLDRAFT_707625 [Exidia glandulosa HHB12029]